MIKLNLGCGLDIKQGYINVDYFDHEGVNLVLDLNNNKLPFQDNSVDEILLYHVLEHIIDEYRFMLECYRVLKKDGLIYVKLPTHAMMVGHLRSNHGYNYFNRLTETGIGFYSNKNFELVKVKGNRKKIRSLIYHINEWLHTWFYEEYEYHLKKV